MARDGELAERAWADVHDLLPEAWAVGPLTFDPGVKGWSVTARNRKDRTR